MILLRIKFPNQITKVQLEGKNATIMHTFAALFQYHALVYGRKTGHLASGEDLGRDAKQWGQKTGCPGKYGTVGNRNGMSFFLMVMDLALKTQVLALALTSGDRTEVIRWTRNRY